MIFKRFSVAVISRTAVLCLSTFLLIYLLTATSFIATPFIVALLIVAQIYSLIHFVQKTNRDVARFFDSIRYSDFSQSFRSNVKGSSFEDLNHAFADVIEQFRKTRSEKEEHYRYLQIVIQHVGVGLIAFTPDGSVDLMNAAAKRLLKVNNLQNISDLGALSTPLVDALRNIKAGENMLVKLLSDNELLQLSIYATEFKMRENHYTLVSLSNIQNELEEREMEAWQNLIRVLTHEIMNSVTPIVSLSSTASNLLMDSVVDGKDGQEIDKDRLNDAKGALDTIWKRSEGLLHFVDDYRNLTRIPIPNFQLINLSGLFSRVQKLFAERLQLRRIRFSFSVEPSNLEVTADPDMVEQVLINLILNSITAVSNSREPSITLAGKTDSRGGILIQVMDNGHGIPEELQEKIFIPFFTTRKEGSGIGLSLSRQIMRAHRGNITVRSTPNTETVFTLKF